MPCKPQAGTAGLGWTGRSPGAAIAEKELAQELGLPRAELAQLRGAVFKENAHWKKDGNLIVWLTAGIEALRAHLQKNGGADDPTKDPVDEALQQPPAVAQPCILLVARLVTNSRIVLARHEDEKGRPTGEMLTVRGLRDSRLLSVGQRIRATKDPHGPVWNWHGAHPLRKGQILVPKAQPGADARTQKEGGAR